LRKILYVLMFMTVTILLTGCFNKENKANEILDYLEKVDSIEGQSRSNLGDFSSEIREITENNDIPEMIRLIEDNVLPTFKEHIEEINEIELHYRSTKNCVKGLSEIDKKESEFTKKLDYYWGVYNIEEYMDE